MGPYSKRGLSPKRFHGSRRSYLHGDRGAIDSRQSGSVAARAWADRIDDPRRPSRTPKSGDRSRGATFRGDRNHSSRSHSSRAKFDPAERRRALCAHSSANEGAERPRRAGGEGSARRLRAAARASTAGARARPPRRERALGARAPRAPGVCPFYLRVLRGAPAPPPLRLIIYTTTTRPCPPDHIFYKG